MAIQKKRVVKGKRIVETVIEPLSDDDKILGVEPKKKTIVKTDYESADRLYKVTNLKLQNTPTIVEGTWIETFIGSNNLTARRELKEGAKKVTTKDYDGNDEYIIEVVE